MTSNLDHLLDEIKKRFRGEPAFAYDQQRIVVIPELSNRYAVRLTPIRLSGSGWNCLVVEILDGQTRAVLGAYVRNYSSFYKTFVPFAKNGRDYALYSKDYTATRVMTLPDCVDIGGEEPDSIGFCPVEFYVPQPQDAIKEEGDEPNPALDGSFGFVSGCVWGDDSSWKVEFVDLRKIEEGKLTREPRFGYIELPSHCTLRESIDLSLFEPDRRTVKVCTEFEFFLHRSVPIVFPDLVYREYERQCNEEDPTRVMPCVNCGEEGRVHEGKIHVQRGQERVCIAYVKEKDGGCGCTHFVPVPPTGGESK